MGKGLDHFKAPFPLLTLGATETPRELRPTCPRRPGTPELARQDWEGRRPGSEDGGAFLTVSSGRAPETLHPPAAFPHSRSLNDTHSTRRRGDGWHRIAPSPPLPLPLTRHTPVFPLRAPSGSLLYAPNLVPQSQLSFPSKSHRRVPVSGRSLDGARLAGPRCDGPRWGLGCAQRRVASLLRMMLTISPSCSFM